MLKVNLTPSPAGANQCTHLPEYKPSPEGEGWVRGFKKPIMMCKHHI